MLTRADWTQQHPDGLFGTHVSLATTAGTARYADMENSGQGAIVPSNTAQRDDAEGFDMRMAIDGASHHDILSGLCEGSFSRDLGEPAGRPVDEGCWPDTAQKLHADR